MWLLEEESEMYMMNILVSNVAITISIPMLAPARETVCQLFTSSCTYRILCLLAIHPILI